MPLHIVHEDITEMDVDAVVNPSNSHMYGYSGIDALVHKKAGPELDELCEQLEPLELGFAKITPGFNLKARFIIHTSGPMWHGGKNGEKALLRSCYLESLKLAKKSGCYTVAFPLISSGNYGYPKDQVLKHAVEVISEFLMDNEMNVLICVHDRNSYEFSKTLYADISRYIDRYATAAAMDTCYSEVDEAPVVYKKAKRMTAPQKRRGTASPTEGAAGGNGGFAKGSLKDYLIKKDAGFADTLFSFIDEKGMTDVECYKKANIDKKLFSKIKSKPQYKPSKQTVLAFAIALELDLTETHQLLRTLGMTLSHSNEFDLIVEYFIVNEHYDVYDINEALFEFDQPLLGSVEK